MFVFATGHETPMSMSSSSDTMSEGERSCKPPLSHEGSHVCICTYVCTHASVWAWLTRKVRLGVCVCLCVHVGVCLQKQNSAITTLKFFVFLTKDPDCHYVAPPGSREHGEKVRGSLWEHQYERELGE